MEKKCECGKIEMMTLTEKVKKGRKKDKEMENCLSIQLMKKSRRRRETKPQFERIKHGENVCNMSGIKIFFSDDEDDENFDVSIFLGRRWTIFFWETWND